MNERIRSQLPFRSPKDDAEKEETYQAWAREPDDGTRFYTIGQGPLVLDTRTGIVCDGVEFLMRKTGFLGRDGAKQMSETAVWKKLKWAIYESRKPFPTEFDAWLNGFLEGMSTAAIIESQHHEGRRK